ncbi:hypothetical protein ExPUPEC79_03893 [Escherichia coli]|nr:hypothetical protein ExPCM16_02321 [Escherichia coli]GDV02529.1 hypothetical protein ExPUPEC79_03893 [Escherichia coli]
MHPPQHTLEPLILRTAQRIWILAITGKCSTIAIVISLFEGVIRQWNVLAECRLVKASPINILPPDPQRRQRTMQHVLIIDRRVGFA